MQNIIWPKGIDPQKYKVRSYNSLLINAPKERVWEVLTDAKSWPEWYPNSRNVKIAGDDFLKSGTTFEWNTFGLRVRSQVVEYKEFESIGWTAQELGGEGYHGWRLIEEGSKTLVVTEEVQSGYGVTLLAPLIKRGLEKQHQIWLEQLRFKCE